MGSPTYEIAFVVVGLAIGATDRDEAGRAERGASWEETRLKPEWREVAEGTPEHEIFPSPSTISVAIAISVPVAISVAVAVSDGSSLT